MDYNAVKARNAAIREQYAEEAPNILNVFLFNILNAWHQDRLLAHQPSLLLEHLRVPIL